MLVQGKWTITMKSPIGPVDTVLELTEGVGGSLTGAQTGQGKTTEISDGKVEGNQISWVNNVTSPMKMKLQFSGTVDGNQIAGKVKAGMMGSFTFTGTRSA